MQFNLFQQLAAGGAGIWVIAVLSVLMMTVAIERFHRFRMRAIVPPGLVDEVVPLWQAGCLDELRDALARRESVLAKAIRFLVANRGRWPAEALGERAGELASRELRQQQQRAYPLAVIATVATTASG